MRRTQPDPVSVRPAKRTLKRRDLIRVNPYQKDLYKDSQVKTRQEYLRCGIVFFIPSKTCLSHVCRAISIGDTCGMHVRAQTVGHVALESDARRSIRCCSWICTCREYASRIFKEKQIDKDHDQVLWDCKTDSFLLRDLFSFVQVSLNKWQISMLKMSIAHFAARRCWAKAESDGASQPVVSARTRNAKGTRRGAGAIDGGHAGLVCWQVGFFSFRQLFSQAQPRSSNFFRLFAELGRSFG